MYSRYAGTISQIKAACAAVRFSPVLKRFRQSACKPKRPKSTDSTASTHTTPTDLVTELNNQIRAGCVEKYKTSDIEMENMYHTGTDSSV